VETERKSSIRCAIYTRKSSEEGLEQSFNSLDAQREACSAYVDSQRHEGWRAIKTHYDDGGYSGGNMDRPGLNNLLQDIAEGRVDTVVVYKVDRLTRSLADFAKIIESFDARKVSFVSVTQQFNTTTSMGRLTLNVLLSFAQFEREVTGERIRDKIAASKRKGMWMGGTVPLGYNVRNRALTVNESEAQLVREIYETYLKTGCVAKLKLALDAKNVVSKRRTSQQGRKSGGLPFSRGALYELLQNRVYMGEIPHKNKSYPGNHAAIVPPELWSDVQAKLASNNQAHRDGATTRNPSLLTGKLFDEQGNRFTPTHAVKNGRRYRYYVSQAVIRTLSETPAGRTRLPAHDIEQVVIRRIKGLLRTPSELNKALGSKRYDSSHPLIAAAKNKVKLLEGDAVAERNAFLRSVIFKAILANNDLKIFIVRAELEVVLGSPSIHSNRLSHRNAGGFCLTARYVASTSSEPSPTEAGPDIETVIPSLARATARAYGWFEKLISGHFASQRDIARETGLDERYVGSILECAFLAPKIITAIAHGMQPKSLTLRKLTAVAVLSGDWQEQQHRLRFSHAAI
jgi:site-specific DNA recombinase